MQRWARMPVDSSHNTQGLTEGAGSAGRGKPSWLAAGIADSQLRARSVRLPASSNVSAVQGGHLCVHALPPMDCAGVSAEGRLWSRSHTLASTFTANQSSPSPSALLCTVLFGNSPYAQPKWQQPQEREKGKKVLKSSHPPCCSWTE